MKNLKVLSLCSGIGAFEKALENLNLNYELIGFSEIDKYAIESYCAIHKVDKSLNLGDISKIDFKDMKEIDFVVGGTPCFKEGTLITTKNGLKPIERVSIGEKVLTHNKRFRKVSKTYLNYSKDIYRLELLGVCDTYVTKEHPYYVVNETKNGFSNPYWKKVKDLQEGDFIVATRLKFSKDNVEEQIYLPFVKKTLIKGFNNNVYNLEVDEDNSYVANGCFVHNCQDFSFAGKQKGSICTCLDCKEEFNPLFVEYDKRNICPNCSSSNLEKTRSSLIVEYLRTIRETKPKYFLYENVKGILSKHNKEGFDIFIKELKNYGYNVYYEVLNSKDYDIPQNRERIYVVGIRNDIKTNFKFPDKRELKTYLEDVLIDQVDDKYFINQESSKYLMSKINEYIKENNEVPYVFNAFNKRNIKSVSPTLITTCGFPTSKSSIVIIYKDKDKLSIRKLLPEECATLMGFNEKDVVSMRNVNISDTQIYKQLGNSISVNVLEYILLNL